MWAMREKTLENIYLFFNIKVSVFFVIIFIIIVDFVNVYLFSNFKFTFLPRISFKMFINNSHIALTPTHYLLNMQRMSQKKKIYFIVYN